METEFLGRLRGRRGEQGQQLLVDVAEGEVVGEQSPVDLGQALEDDGAGREFLAHTHKGPHDVDAHRNGARTAQKGRGHDRAVLGEGPRQLSRAAIAREGDRPRR